MAEYAARLKVRNGSTVQDIRIYSTEADIPPWQRPMKVRLDSEFEGWVPTSPLGSPDASILRVRHPDSNAIYVVNTIGRAVADETWYLTPGAISFVVPAGVRRLRVVCIGGGGGGNFGFNTSTSSAPNSTVFSGVVAIGGQGAPQSEVPKGPYSNNGYYLNKGITTGGTKVTDAASSPADVFGPYYSYGCGAGSPGGVYGRPGALGQYVEKVIDVAPGATVTGTVGSGAPARSGSVGVRRTDAGAGAPGCIYLQWGGNIE